MVYVLIASVVVILLLTQFPLFAAIRVGFDPFFNRLTQSVTLGLRLGDAFGNVMLFIPFGYAGIRLAIKGISTSRLGHAIAITLLGALLSIMIEGGQMLLPRRTPSFYDIFFNTLGTAVGVALALLRLRLLERHGGVPIIGE